MAGIFAHRAAGQWNAQHVERQISVVEINLPLMDESEGLAAFDSLMFFGDNGGGDQFAFVRRPEAQEVFVLRTLERQPDRRCEGGTVAASRAAGIPFTAAWPRTPSTTR
jgi:hypothetical protein